MARKFRELVDKLPPERRAAIKAGADRLRGEMALDELREALNLTQESLAESLHVTQATISKVERRSDMFISTLRKIIEGMGGALEIRAILPDGIVRISQFEAVRVPARAKQSDETSERERLQRRIDELELALRRARISASVER